MNKISGPEDINLPNVELCIIFDFFFFFTLVFNYVCFFMQTCVVLALKL